MKSVKRCNRLPREVVQSLFLKFIKPQLGNVLETVLEQPSLASELTLL